MAVIAYMLTWTTYGTWLQGDRRCWVKDARICKPNSALEDANRRQMKDSPAALSKEQRIIAGRTIANEAMKLNQKLFALAVCRNHIHLVVQNIDLPVGRVVSHYKHAVRLALQERGFRGKLWTRGFDKRYCMNDKELAGKIAYVQGHMNTGAGVMIGDS